MYIPLKLFIWRLRYAAFMSFQCFHDGRFFSVVFLTVVCGSNEELPAEKRKLLSLQCVLKLWFVISNMLIEIIVFKQQTTQFVFVKKNLKGIVLYCGRNEVVRWIFWHMQQVIRDWKLMFYPNFYLKYDFKKDKASIEISLNKISLQNF